MVAVSLCPELINSEAEDHSIRILVFGRSGSGKSSSLKTARFQNLFSTPAHHRENIITTCEESSYDVAGRKVNVINTPDLLDPDLTEDQLILEKQKLRSLCQSGLDAVLLVVPVGEQLHNEEQILDFIK